MELTAFDDPEPVAVPELASELLLMAGCSDRQMKAVLSLLDTLERAHANIHLGIVGLRALSHCGRPIERDADALHWLSNELLTGLRQQRDSVAGLVGKK